MKAALWFEIAIATALISGCGKHGGTADERFASSGSGASTKTNFVLPQAATTNATNGLSSNDRGMSRADKELVRRIRGAMAANEKLAASAKGLRIVAINGKVTIQGPVNSAEERKVMVSIVKDAGATTFDDRLEVKGQ